MAEDFATPRTWEQLRNWLRGKQSQALYQSKDDEAELVGEVLTRMDEMVNVVPRVSLAERMITQKGAHLGRTFVTEDILNAVGCGDEITAADLSADVGQALHMYGLVTDAGSTYRPSERGKQFWDAYQAARDTKSSKG